MFTSTAIKPPIDNATTSTQPDLAAIKARQQGTWASGDYAVIGTTLQVVGEQLCEALDVRSGQRVLDVAAGNGNVTLGCRARALVRSCVYRLRADVARAWPTACGG